MPSSKAANRAHLHLELPELILVRMLHEIAVPARLGHVDLRQLCDVRIPAPPGHLVNEGMTLIWHGTRVLLFILAAIESVAVFVPSTPLTLPDSWRPRHLLMIFVFS